MTIETNKGKNRSPVDDIVVALFLRAYFEANETEGTSGEKGNQQSIGGLEKPEERQEKSGGGKRVEEVRSSAPLQETVLIGRGHDDGTRIREIKADDDDWEIERRLNRSGGAVTPKGWGPGRGSGTSYGRFPPSKNFIP